MPRDTRTGAVLESMVLPALNFGGYVAIKQKKIGERPSGGIHKIDVLASNNEKYYLISLKWQQVSGTAEQKIPFEVICLRDAVKNGTPNYIHDFEKSYLVLGGDKWTLRDFYINNLHTYLPHRPYVQIVTLEAFVALANSGKL